jgi:hypothetical protein
VFRYPFRGSVAVASGRLTTAQLRGPRFRRLFPDVYIAADVSVDHYVMCRAAALYAGPAAVISGLSAAYVWGVDRQPQAVELTIPPARRLRTAGLTVRREAIGEADLQPRRGLVITSATRTTFDLGRRLPRIQAMIAIDAMMSRGITSTAALCAYAVQHHRLRGAFRIDELASLAEPLTESPMETVCRLVIVDGGLPRPVAQHAIQFNKLTFVRLDLAYPQWLIGIEYEGDYHRDRTTFRKDITRYRTLEDMGWKIVRVTADDVLRKPDELVARLRRLINARCRDPKTGLSML